MRHNLKDSKLDEEAKHLRLLSHVNAVLATSSGVEVFKHLLDDLCAFELPTEGLEGFRLHESLGFHRAGNSLKELIAEANPEMLGHILGKIKKEKQNVNTKELSEDEHEY